MKVEIADDLTLGELNEFFLENRHIIKNIEVTRDKVCQQILTDVLGE